MRKLGQELDASLDRLKRGLERQASKRARVTCARVPVDRRQGRDQPRLGLDSVHANSSNATSGGEGVLGGSR